MAELHSNIYYKHIDPDVMEKLNSIFYECNGNEEKIIEISLSLNARNGKELAQNLIESVDEPKYDLDAESLEKVEGYSIAHFVHGSIGDEVVESIVHFLNLLVPNTHVQAWGCGDDDPWEYWIKYDNDKLIRKDDEPLNDDDEDEEIKNTIYEWWHESMPSSVKEGFLNEINLEDQYIVFTGKMEQGTREEMEELAEEFGANVQKSINGKTTILVVGEKPGSSKLAKAQELNVKIITEKEFYDITE
jgi:NAD-dependent DNA ligase